MENVCEEKRPPKNCLHEIIDNLVVHHNDYHRMKTELSNLQEEFKVEMQQLQFPCEELRKALCCKNYEKSEGDGFLKRMMEINNVYNCFTKRIEKLKENIQQVLANGQICLQALCVSKENMKKTHDRKVEDLKRLAMQSNDEKEIACYEKKICELHKTFAKEVAFVKQAELHLQPFFDHLKADQPQEYIECNTFKAYEWMPTGKRFDAVNVYAKEIMTKMGRSLVQAFAQQHIQQPTDVKGFLASYLLNLERNQKLLQEKMDLLSATPKNIACEQIL